MLNELDRFRWRGIIFFSNYGLEDIKVTLLVSMMTMRKVAWRTIGIRSTRSPWVPGCASLYSTLISQTFLQVMIVLRDVVKDDGVIQYKQEAGAKILIIT